MPLRRSGLGLVGDIPWGTHLCHFFENDEDLLDTVLPYFKAGLEARELCVWVVADPLTPALAVEALRRAVPGVDRYLDDRSIEIHPHRDWYGDVSHLDVARVTASWERKLTEALDRGFAGLRVNGTVAWLENGAWRSFCEYEDAVDASMAGKRMIALCTYPLAGSLGAQVLDVARTHQLIVAKRGGRSEKLETPAARAAELEAVNAELTRALAEQARERETLKAVFDNIPVMISIYDPAGRLLSVNREWEKTLGWTLDEARTTDFLREAYPDEARRQAVLTFIRTADRQWKDFAPRTRGGEVIDTAWTRFVLSDGSRVGIGIDITERKRAEAALADAEDRFAKAFQASPAALALSTIESGRIVDVNERWLETFGYTRSEAIGRTHGDLHINVDPRARDAAAERVREGGVVRDLDLQVQTKSGEIRDLTVSAVRISAAGEECWISSHIDVTERKRATAERDRLFESERAARAEAEAALERLRAIESITDGALRHLGLDELLDELLARLQRALETDSATVLLLEDAQTLYPRAGHGYVLDTSVRVRVGAGVSGTIAKTGEPLICDDYSTVDITGIDGIPTANLRAVASIMGVPLRIGDNVMGVVVVSSHRHRRFSAEELRLLGLVADRVAPAVELGRMVERVRGGRERQKILARRLLTAQEEERRRLAMELHDELGQVLTAIKINLGSLERWAGALAVAAPRHLCDALASVDQAMQTVRDLALDLRPSVLDDLGLAAALRWYADRFARGGGFEMRVSIDPFPPLPPELETACFRVAQEALTNVARHARARGVRIDLKVLSENIELSVRDDGVGFDVAAAREQAISGGSMGLLGMQERVLLVGGELDISSPPGGGTWVRARFPTGETNQDGE